MAIESLQNHFIFNFFFSLLFGQILPIKTEAAHHCNFQAALNLLELDVGESLLFHYLVFDGLA